MSKNYTIGFDVDSIECDISEIFYSINKYIEDNPYDKIILFGDENKIKQYNNKSINNLKIINTIEKITSNDDPVISIRKKKQSSIVLASNMLKKNEIDAFISSGSTGALVAAGIFIVGRIKGIKRPALGGAIPKYNSNKPVFLMDLGASSEIKEENLNQFAEMGSIYLKNILGVNDPKVRLLNIGEEENKGSDLYKKAYYLLKQNEKIKFLGNLEARDIFTTDADVIVMDGFIGNSVLKTIEATAQLFGRTLKDIIYKSFKNKILGLLLNKDIKKELKKYDYKELGGTPIFGINGLIIKAHGSSDSRAFLNALKVAKINLDNDLIHKFNEINKEGISDK